MVQAEAAERVFVGRSLVQPKEEVVVVPTDTQSIPSSQTLDVRCRAQLSGTLLMDSHPLV